LPNRLLNAFRVFAFLAQKTSLTNFFGRKHRLRLTDRGLAMGWYFIMSSPEPKLTIVTKDEGNN